MAAWLLTCEYAARGAVSRAGFAPLFTVVVRSYGHAMGTSPRGDAMRGRDCSTAVLHLWMRDVPDTSACRSTPFHGHLTAGDIHLQHGQQVGRRRLRTLVPGILRKAYGKRIHAAVLPYVDSAQAAHLAYRRSLEQLREMGVLIMSYEPHRPRAGCRADRFRWPMAVLAIRGFLRCPSWAGSAGP